MREGERVLLKQRDVILKRDRHETQRTEPRAMAKFNHPHVVTLFEIVSSSRARWLPGTPKASCIVT